VQSVLIERGALGLEAGALLHALPAATCSTLAPAPLAAPSSLSPRMERQTGPPTSVDEVTPVLPMGNMA